MVEEHVQQMNLLLYAIPLLPLLTRATVMLVVFRSHALTVSYLSELLQAHEQARTEQSSVIIALLTLCFTGLTALAVIDATVLNGFLVAMFYLFVGFLLFFLALQRVAMILTCPQVRGTRTSRPNPSMSPHMCGLCDVGH